MGENHPGGLGPSYVQDETLPEKRDGSLVDLPIRIARMRIRDNIQYKTASGVGRRRDRDYEPETHKAGSSCHPAMRLN